MNFLHLVKKKDQGVVLNLVTHKDNISSISVNGESISSSDFHALGSSDFYYFSENLYNKYPAPKLFYDRKKSAKENISIVEGAFYIDDTYPQYLAVLEDLDQKERDRVCLSVYEWLIQNKYGQMVSEDFIIERLKQFRPQVKDDSFLEVSDERVKWLIQTSIKTIS